MAQERQRGNASSALRYPPIRILERDNNKKGDLFGRLMADVFIAMGYDQPRLNIHKSGREIDLEAEHRLEARRAIAECKATKAPIGGDALNKFAGVLDAERRTKQLTGYFVSLAGFTEVALEQERNRRRSQIVLLTAADAVEELIQGLRLISRERAAELSGRCWGALEPQRQMPELELLAHDRGWVWAVYYSEGKERTHFALIHADGTPLARAVADEIIAADQGCGGTLQALTYLNPAPSLSENATDTQEALILYRRYLESECGYIHLDGLPADSEVGSRRLRLESLFIPLHLELTASDGKPNRRVPIGEVLSESHRVALLAAPGGGKSTLIKRLAIAYSEPERRKQV